jgi:hypothetical protein
MKCSKSSKTWFEGRLQTEAEGVKRIVCFSPEKYSAIQEMGSPDAAAVTITTFKEDGDDIVMNFRTKVLTSAASFSRSLDVNLDEDGQRVNNQILRLIIIP